MESYYEAFLLDSFKTLCEFFQKADKKNLIILQALEIDSKISILYKEHMRLLYSKKIKGLPLSKEMKAISTKYYFQKHLNNLFDSPEKLKDIAFDLKEKEAQKLPDLSLQTCVPFEEFKKIGILYINFLSSSYD